jgi:hypothetical protein
VSVYVDDMRAPFGRMVMCHMLADSTEELNAMADRIGVARRWIQSAGTHREHYDVCKEKRALAVQHGAIEIDVRELAVKLRARNPNLRESDTPRERPGDTRWTKGGGR